MSGYNVAWYKEYKRKIFADPVKLEAWRARHRAYAKKKYRTVVKPYKLKKQYGISAADYSSILGRQNGVCALCFKKDPDGRDLAVDHCHKSQKVRGLLCRPCNTALGLLNEDPELLARAAAYLLHNSKPE